MTRPKCAYFKGKIVPYEDAKIGVMTHSLNYGTAVFGGIRGYWNEEEQQLYLFRPRDHFKRFLASAKIMVMDLGLDIDGLIKLTIDLLHHEGRREDVYVRPLAYKADEAIGVKLHGLIDELTIFAVPFNKYVANDTNAHVTVSSWRRLDDNAIPARGKISGAYANSALIKTDAVRAGFDEALVLTAEGHISEGSAMNVFMIRDGKLVTPPRTENILEGITRASVLTIALQELDLEVVERPIDRTEVFLCEELFMSGTAAQITAVTRVDHREIGAGEMGPHTARLRELFADIVRGRSPRYRDWNVPVY
ncbi:MAG TPA: branched-chain amino acid transaminase [Anaerolineales bacterium]|nr:branched-chain amino acid transaminase [Anaerolineales bacterium]